MSEKQLCNEPSLLEKASKTRVHTPDGDKIISEMTKKELMETVVLLSEYCEHLMRNHKKDLDFVSEHF